MKNTNILIIEDEPVTALSIKKMLEKIGYSVPEIITSGEEALERLKEMKPDLILMDITLAGAIDGIEAAIAVNENYGIPIVFLTENTNLEVIQRASKTTLSYGYLLKPVKGFDLQLTINTAMRRHSIERVP
ncbi:MAG: response regulator [Spirochaetes bacterium]|nr:response regulator [Spirochaetota bacterium]